MNATHSNAATTLPVRQPLTSEPKCGDVDHPPLATGAAVAGEQVWQLDTAMVRESPWAERDQSSYRSVEYKNLVNDIRGTRGNVQPIRVRGLSTPEGRCQYEVVFGHRRLRACRELGLPVNAVVVKSMSDQALFAEMQAENRHRSDLSPLDQGRSYCRALDARLFVSARKLAEALGVDFALVSKAVRIARLPEEVLSAFQQSRDLQYRFLKPLEQAIAEGGECVIQRARKLSFDETARSGKDVLQILLGIEGDEAPMEEAIRVDDRTVATLRRKRQTASAETIEFTEPLGEYNKARIVGFMQKLFAISRAPRSSSVGAPR